MNTNIILPSEFIASDAKRRASFARLSSKHKTHELKMSGEKRSQSDDGRDKRAELIRLDAVERE